MASLREKVQVELENIALVLEELKTAQDEPNKRVVELAGIGAFLHNFYNGVENILKQILNSQGIQILRTDSWHQDLLIQAKDTGIISESTKKQLAEYLAFRHFFSHAYGFTLDEKELMLLVGKVFRVYSTFKTEIDSFLHKTKSY
jgi:uncharacterized protein YutE (UPF0331/DUF86 family)